MQLVEQLYANFGQWANRLAAFAGECKSTTLNWVTVTTSITQTLELFKMLAGACGLSCPHFGSYSGCINKLKVGATFPPLPPGNRGAFGARHQNT